MPDMEKDFAETATNNVSIDDIINIEVSVSNNTIESVLNDIKSEKIFLPCIQRDFIWDKERIYKLLDSFMRGFPIGTIMAWETNEQVNYRNFEQDYSSQGGNNDFMPVGDNKSIIRQYILDGQQRLQSLYIAIRGAYDNKKLFFDLRSKPTEYYFFDFRNPRVRVDGWINVRNFLSKSLNSDNDILNELKQLGVISEDRIQDRDLMLRNAKRLYDVFKMKENVPIQKLTNVSLQDIAEIFIRTNSGGIVLIPEDLIMAAITGKWIASNRKFADLTETLDGLGFNNPKGFIIQACYAVLLQTVGNSMTIQNNFNVAAIRTTLKQNVGQINDAIVDVLNVVSKFDAVRRFATPHNNPIFILIAYRYAHGRNQWEAHKDTAIVFLLISLFCRDFVVPTQRIIKDLLEYVMSPRGRNFDLQGVQRIFYNHNRRFEFDVSSLLDCNRSMRSSIAPIVMYLVYYGQPGYDPQTMTVRDHIFPRSQLRDYRNGINGQQIYTDVEIDSILNCELLTVDKNSNSHKGDRLPNVYFTNTNDFNGSNRELKRFLDLHAIPARYQDQDGIDRWDISHYKEFLAARRDALIQRIIDNFAGIISDEGGNSPAVQRFIDNLNQQINNNTSLTIDDD